MQTATSATWTYFVEKRAAARVSQESIARDLGVTQTTVSRWEHGKRAPHAAVITRLARILNVDSTDLLHEIGRSFAAPPPKIDS